MAEQNIGFNLNEISYEGAGKVYEALATNSGQDAQQAGMDKNMYAQEAASARSRFQQYYSASNATRSQAGSQLANATATLHGRNTQQNAAVDAYERNTSIKVSNALGNVGEYFKQAEVDSKSLEGTTEGLKLKGDLMDLKDRDPEAVINKVETLMADLEANPTDPYLKALAKQAVQAYMPARTVKEDNRIQANLAAFGAYLEEGDGSLSATDMKGFAKTHDMDVALLRDVQYMSVNKKWATELAQVNTKQEQTAVNEKYTKFTEDNFDNNYFLKSKSPHTQQMVTKTTKELTAANTAAEKRIQFNDERMVVGAEKTLESDNALGISPEVVDTKLVDLYGDSPKELANKRNEYKKKYTKHVDKVEFNAEVDVARPRPDKHKVPKVDTAYIDKKTYERVMPAYEAGNTSIVIDTIRNNSKEELESVTKHLTSSMNSAETQEQLTMVVGDFQKVIGQPGGAAAMRKIMPDETYTDMVGLKYATDILFKGDVARARDWLDTAKGNPKAAITLRDLKNTMGNRQTKLGDNFPAYQVMMNNLNRISPELAVRSESTIASYFNDMKVSVDGSDRVLNTANGPDVVTPASMNPEKVWNVLDNITNKIIPGEVGSHSMTHNGDVVIKGDFGAVLKTVNPQPIVDRENADGLAARQADIAENGLPVGEIISSGTVNVVEGIGESFSTIGSKLGNHIVENDPEFFEFLGEAWDTAMETAGAIFSNDAYSIFGNSAASSAYGLLNSNTPNESEAKPLDKYKVVVGNKEIGIKSVDKADRILTGLEVIKNLNTTTSLEGVITSNPLDNIEEIQIQESQRKNKVNVQKIEQVQEAIVTEQMEIQDKEVGTGNPPAKLISSVFKAEAGYSTDVNDTGNYYNGKFVGTNHGISAPILAEALGRTPTVKDMKALTKGKAREIYKEKYYTSFGINELPTNLREIVFHSVINSGSHGIKTVQELVGLPQDGVVGPNTLAAMKKAKFTKSEFGQALIRRYKTFKTWRTHGKGWTKRFQDLAK